MLSSLLLMLLTLHGLPSWRPYAVPASSVTPLSEGAPMKDCKHCRHVRSGPRATAVCGLTHEDTDLETLAFGRDEYLLTCAFARATEMLCGPRAVWFAGKRIWWKPWARY